MCSFNFNIVGKRAWYFLLLVCLLALLIVGKTYAADENKQKISKSASVRRKSPDPYCGLYCVYAVMKLTGQKVDLRELVNPEYIGSRKGSSVQELKRAVENYGLHAMPVHKLTGRVLRSCRHPVILHVKPDAMSREYDHYELYLGTENGQARLFDPPNPMRLVPFMELAPRWDGNGLIVSAEPIDLGAIFKPARKRFIMYVAVAIAAILAIHWAKRRLPEALFNSRSKLLGLSIGQGIVFAIATLLCGMIYHFANDEGLLANANAIASIQEAHIGNFIPKVSEKKILKLLDSDTIFFDARYARDYKAGHLEGAINVPVDANDVERRKATANIAKDAHIVVYCQSAACKFAEKVAIKLMDDGFSNFSIFRGGWQEWVAKNGKPKEAAL